MTTLTAARRQILDGLLAELAADERNGVGDRSIIREVQALNAVYGELDAAEPDPADDDATAPTVGTRLDAIWRELSFDDDDATALLWDESGDRP